MHSSMSPQRDKGRNPEDLKRLLLRFDADPERAWERYSDLRRRLAKYFEWNHCTAPEDLADEVFDRVAAKLDSEEIRDVDKYLFGVAGLVRLEAYKKTRPVTPIEDLPGGENALPQFQDQSAEIVDGLDQERRLACLRQCLATLTPSDRELVIQYYSAEEEKQKTFRQKLAEKAGLKLGTLRVRINRLRERLEECVRRRLESRQGVLAVS